MLKFLVCLVFCLFVMCSVNPVSPDNDQPKMAKIFIPKSGSINAQNITLKSEGNIAYQFSSVFLPDTFTFIEGKHISAFWKTTGGQTRVDTIAIDGLEWILNY